MFGLAAAGLIGVTAARPEWLPEPVKAVMIYSSVFVDMLHIPFVVDDLWWLFPFVLAPMTLGIIYVLSRLARGGG